MITDLTIEKKIWKKDLLCVGIDEVGRGPFAGPMVMAGCIFSSDRDYLEELGESIRIDDSKKLTEKQRVAAKTWITQNAFCYSVAKADALYIDAHGLTKTTQKLFQTVIEDIISKSQNDISVLSDQMLGVRPPEHERIKSCEFLVKGDSQCFSIACASIIAKVYRDAYMKKLAQEFPEYGWETNVGYGTKHHKVAIQKYGPTKHHRLLFLKNRN